MTQKNNSSVEKIIRAAFDPKKEIDVPTVVFMSDFGNTDAVATCHQMMLRFDHNIRIINFNHSVEPFNVAQGSVLLIRSKDFVNKTVFMAVVDPGVGTKRESIILHTKQRDFYFVGPNNGLFTDVANMFDIEEIYEIVPEKANPNWAGFTFDGRDLYSPVAALIATTNGKAMNTIGKKISQSQLVRLNTSERVQHIESNKVKAKILAIDEPFGNIWTVLTKKDMFKIGAKPDSFLNITLPSQNQVLVKWVHAFGYTEPGQELAYTDSRNGIDSGYIALAINKGDFRKKHNLNTGEYITIST